MKLKSKKILLTSLFATTIILTAITSIVLTSCSKQTNSEVILKNNEFLNNENQWMNDTYKIPKFQKVSSYLNETSPIQQLYLNAKNAVIALTSLKETSQNLSINEEIWLDSFISQWNTKIGNIKNGIIYLGSDPIAGTRMLSSRSNHVSTYIKNAINIYDLDSETGDPDTTKPNKDLIKTVNKRIDDVISYIDHLYNFLNEGMNAGVMPSNLVKKSYIKQMVEFFYIPELNSKLTNDSIQLDIADLFRGTSLKYFDDFKSKYLEESQKISYTNKELDSKLTSIVEMLNKFMTFYSGEYYTSTHSFGYVTSQSNQDGNKVDQIKISKTNGNTEDNKEIEQSISLSSTSNAYGLGYSKKELELKNIGIGFMKPVGKNIEGQVYQGNDIYNQQLINNNSINTPATEIYERGIKLTADSKSKMISIAKQVVSKILKHGNEYSSWDPEIQYTSDPFSIKPTKQKISTILGSTVKKLTSDDLLLAKFNAWLNQEDFFFGRETINTSELVQKYWTNADNDKELSKYKNVITKQGYKENWEGVVNINGSTATVAGNNALAGAVSSLESYTQFKLSTDGLFAKNFNPIYDYVLSPYNYEIRKDIGVGMEGPRGSKQFQYNCDPYYSLQKWSVASLTVHEGAMGHHTQQQYWTQYMPGSSNGTIPNSNITPGYTFENDSFHEGWAVFTEWFAAELGIYGTWGDNKNDGDVLPTDWTKNNSTILNIKDVKNVTENEINFIKNYQSGVYWNIVNSLTNDKAYSNDSEKAVAATELANMLAYYGYLNEAQLRNMRLVLDTSINYNGSANSSNQITFGASIQDERNYMKSNSGLGSGDINSESIRYMCIPSQATGYMLGKIIINDLYNEIKAKYAEGTNFAIDKKNIIKHFFDLTLRNGEIPLNVLQNIVKKEMKL